MTKRSPIVEPLSESIIEPNIECEGIWFTHVHSDKREGARFRPGPKGTVIHVIDRKRGSVTVVASRADGRKPVHRASIAASHPRQIYVETLKAMAKLLEIHNWRDVPDTTEVEGWCTVSTDLAKGFKFK